MKIGKFNTLYNKYYDRALYLAKSYVHSDVIAEDIVADSFEKLWEYRPDETIDSDTKYVMLLFTIIKNKSLDHLKHELVKQDAIDNIRSIREKDLLLRISSLNEFNPSDIFSEDIKEIYLKTLSKLDEKTRRIYLLSREKNMSNSEIARLEELSNKSVEYHMSKALKALRVALKDYLYILFLLG